MRLPILRTLLLTGSLLVAAAPLDAQRRGRDDPYASRVDTTFAFEATGTVELSLVSGSIAVTGWARNEVRVNAHSEEGTLELSASSSRVRLTIRGDRRDDDDGYGVGDADYVVSVPAGARVILRATSGDLESRGVTGEVDAHSVSGDIDVSGGTNVTVESVSGDITVERLGGDVRLSTVSGDIDARDVRGEVEAQSVSGDIDLVRSGARQVRGRTTSGDITYAGAIDAGGQYVFRSHSGSIDLALPQGAGGQLSLATFSGSIDSDLPLTLPPTGERVRGPRSRRLEVAFGTGSARVSAETFSGAIRITRASGSATGSRDR